MQIIYLIEENLELPRKTNFPIQKTIKRGVLEPNPKWYYFSHHGLAVFLRTAIKLARVLLVRKKASDFTLRISNLHTAILTILIN